MYELIFKLMKRYRVFILHFTILVLNIFYCDGKCGYAYKVVAKSVIVEECVLYGRDTGLGFEDCARECNNIRNCFYFIHQGMCIYIP